MAKYCDSSAFTFGLAEPRSSKQTSNVKRVNTRMMDRSGQTIVLALVVALLSGCATVSRSRPYQPTLQTIDLPKLGEVRSVELGETILEKGRIFVYDAIDLKKNVTGGDGVITKKFTIPSGILRASSESDQHKIFMTQQATAYDALIGTMPAVAGLAISNTDATTAWVFAYGRLIKPSEPPQFTMTKVNAIDRPSFKQEFIYNGRTGDAVKFLYREFSGDLMRAAFSQELQYDLSEGKIIGFKGLRVEIIKASNTKLEYRVLSSFPD